MENESKIKDCLRWPTREGIMEIEPEIILCKVHEPVRSGKRERFFKITDEDRNKIAEVLKGQ